MARSAVDLIAYPRNGFQADCRTAITGPATALPKFYSAEKVQTLCRSQEDLRAGWQNADPRAAIIQQVADRGIDFPTVAAQAGRPDANPFDLLCHLAYNAPLLTRRQRADRVKKNQAALFD